MTSLARSLTVEHYEYETVDFWMAERVMALVFGSPELLDASAVAADIVRQKRQNLTADCLFRAATGKTQR